MSNHGANDLTTQTPVEIDGQLAVIWNKYYSKLDVVERIERRLDWMSGSDFRGLPLSSASELTKVEDELQAARDVANAVLVEAIPFNEEFDRRGGWTRAYLVDNNNGHLHRSRNCSTCFPSTRFYWVTELSGSDEAKIVEAAGESACTVCYPSAPVDVLKRASSIMSPSRIEREAAAAEKAAKKAEKQAAAVLDPETGEILFKTERGATNSVSENLQSSHWYGSSHPSYFNWQRDARRAVIAVAARRGVDANELFAELNAKAAAKVARDRRG